MKLQSYYAVRKQLAAYMKNRILDNYNNFGGRAAVAKWFREQCSLHNKEILDILYNNLQTTYKEGNWITTDDIIVIICKSFGWSSEISYNTTEYDGSGKSYLACVINKHQPVDTIFKIQFYTWKGLTQIFGELPKVIDGYVRNRQNDGNSIIDATDLVSEVGTPMEDRTVNEYSFEVTIGFSKAGFNKFKKNWPNITIEGVKYEYEKTNS